MKSQRLFVKYAYFVLLYTILVIMWGAYVRATGSGAGCGEHWPLCNGEVFPLEGSVKRMIEFSHRLTSGLSLLLVALQLLLARRIFSPGHPARTASVWTLVFILGEALVGAMLVLLSLVENNTSTLRAVVIALHLTNTFLLLYWQTNTIESSKLALSAKKTLSQAGGRTALLSVMILYVLTGAIGAVVALGDTLFPASSIAHGLSQELDAASHFLVRLRIFHPIIAVLGSIYIIFQLNMLSSREQRAVSRPRAKTAIFLISLQVIGGFVNWMLLAPIWMQLFHLVLADATWVVLCMVYLSRSEFREN